MAGAGAGADFCCASKSWDNKRELRREALTIKNCFFMKDPAIAKFGATHRFDAQYALTAFSYSTLAWAWNGEKAQNCTDSRGTGASGGPIVKDGKGL
jgi:hypothetical protein